MTITKSCPCIIIINHPNNLPNCPIISTLLPNSAAMNDIERNEVKIRKALLVISILFALVFVIILIYEIANHERWQVCAPIGALVLISTAHAVRLFRIVKRDS